MQKHLGRIKVIFLREAKVPVINAEYIGDGNWECPKYGRVIPFGEPDDDDDGESLSVYDAALIRASNGKDEEYTFCYSEDELERALR